VGPQQVRQVFQDEPEVNLFSRILLMVNGNAPNLFGGPRQTNGNRNGYLTRLRKKMFNSSLKKVAVALGIPVSVVNAAAGAAESVADSKQGKLPSSARQPFETRNWSIGGILGGVLGPSITSRFDSVGTYVWYVGYLGAFMAAIALAVYLYVTIVEKRAKARLTTALLPIAQKAGNILAAATNQTRNLVKGAQTASNTLQNAFTTTQEIIDGLKRNLSQLNNINSEEGRRLQKKIAYFMAQKGEELADMGKIWQGASRVASSLLPNAAAFTQVVANATSRGAAQMQGRPNAPPRQAARSLLRNGATAAATALGGPVGGMTTRLLLTNSRVNNRSSIN
jgi:hypothetical protein